MLTNNKSKKLITGIIFVFVICLLILIFLIVTKRSASGDSLISKDEQIELMKKDIGITVSDASSIIEFTYSKKAGDFNAKIAIKKEDINKFKLEISNFLGNEITEAYDMWHFENTCPWWDLKKENVKVTFRNIVGKGDGSAADSSYTRIVWAFIVQNEDKYYLYISY